jgi:hypothetical protein
MTTGTNHKLICWLSKESNNRTKLKIPEAMAEIRMAVFFCDEKIMVFL